MTSIGRWTPLKCESYSCGSILFHQLPPEKWFLLHFSVTGSNQLFFSGSFFYLRMFYESINLVLTLHSIRLLLPGCCFRKKKNVTHASTLIRAGFVSHAGDPLAQNSHPARLRMHTQTHTRRWMEDKMGLLKWNVTGINRLTKRAAEAAEAVAAAAHQTTGRNPEIPSIHFLCGFPSPYEQAPLQGWWVIQWPTLGSFRYMSSSHMWSWSNLNCSGCGCGMNVWRRGDLWRGTVSNQNIYFHFNTFLALSFEWVMFYGRSSGRKWHLCLVLVLP